MNAELPPFKNGEHNSERASTVDRDITPLSISRDCPWLITGAALYTSPGGSKAKTTAATVVKSGVPLEKSLQSHDDPDEVVPTGEKPHVTHTNWVPAQTLV